jgi:hypothetical protein
MFRKKNLSVSALRQRGGLYTQRAVGGLALVMLHEWDALSRHGVALGERLAVARNARGPFELVRDQLDLLAETRARLAMDQRERRALLHSWLADLRGGILAAA